MNLKDFNITRQDGTLSNGIRVILFYKKNTPLYIRTVIKAGSCFDPKGKEGLSHFLEHMLSEGSNKFQSKDALADHIESVGGTFSLATDTELMWINTEIGASDDIGKITDVLSAILAKPILNSERVERERGVVLSEITRADSNPEKILVSELLKEIYSQTNFDHPPRGFFDSVSSIQTEDLSAHYDNLVTAEKITFIACGDVDLKILIEHLEKIPILNKGKEHTPRNISYTIELPSIKKHIFHEMKQVQLFFGFRSTGMFVKDSLRLRVIGQILSGGRASRLMKRLRYDLGLIYTIKPARYGNLHDSVYGVITDMTPEKKEWVTKELVSEFKELTKSGITDIELQLVKSRMIKSQKRLMQRSEDWVNFHYYGESLSPENNWRFDEYLSELESLTVNDINETIKKYIDVTKLYIISVGNRKTPTL